MAAALCDLYGGRELGHVTGAERKGIRGDHHTGSRQLLFVVLNIFIVHEMWGKSCVFQVLYIW